MVLIKSFTSIFFIFKMANLSIGHFICSINSDEFNLIDIGEQMKRYCLTEVTLINKKEYEMKFCSF